MTKRSPFRYFKTSPEVIRLAVIMYIRFPVSLRNVEDLLHERGLCCTNPMRDSSRESSVVAGWHEQTHTPLLQDQELARL
jgi:hypothetical protein